MTESVLVPPLKVGVDPTMAPLVPFWRVKLWAVDELSVKAILTAPALALRVFLVKASWPLGSAAMASAPEAAPPAALGGRLGMK